MSSTGSENVPLWINNSAIHTETTIPITSAKTTSTIHHASSATPSHATQAVDSSWTAFKSWRHTTHVERRDLILRVADHIASHAPSFITAQVSETSCTTAWASQNVSLTVRYLREIAAQVSSVSGIIPPIEKPHTLGFVFKEPVGPILCIAPWNAAMILATRGIASAIAVGCSVVFKASELCPRTHFLITTAFVESGVPPGVLNQVQCRREDAAEVTETLIAHEGIRKVEFIGSAAVGRKIMSTAAKYLKPVILELGGKCPAVVLEDADLEEAAKQCALGAVLHHGQICFSTERVIVMADVAERFQELLVQEMKGLGEKGVAGCAVSLDIAKHAEDVIRDAQDRGDKILVGGIDGEADQLSLKPTIILNPKDSRIVDEETFGPSASLYVVNSDEEAIALANRSAYGLNATVWTKDMSRFLKISKELEYGQVHANSISVYTAPTGSQGGVKGSGFGRQNGKWGLEAFVVEKFVTWCG
jgi:acyl-CoA reductase-like NAD-dependent aldehyde dehydrogenase